MDQRTAHQINFVKVVVWKRDKVLVEFHPETNIDLKYDLPTFLVAPGADVHESVRNEMRKAFRMSVGDVVDTGIKTVNRTAMGGDHPTFVQIDFIACDYQSMFKDTLLTVDPPLFQWIPARVAHALFVKHQKKITVDGHIEYLSKFL